MGLHYQDNTDGSTERFKARLVARGFSQVHGQDYTETFAPTVQMDTLRLFLATVAAEDLECAQFDIKNAFTEAHLKEKIYTRLEPLNQGRASQMGFRAESGRPMHVYTC